MFGQAHHRPVVSGEGEDAPIGVSARHVWSGQGAGHCQRSERYRGHWGSPSDGHHRGRAGHHTG